jgi:hypothetical protein
LPLSLSPSLSYPLTVVRGLLLGHGIGFALLGLCLFFWSMKMLR